MAIDLCKRCNKEIGEGDVLFIRDYWFHADCVSPEEWANLDSVIEPIANELCDQKAGAD